MQSKFFKKNQIWYNIGIFKNTIFDKIYTKYLWFGNSLRL